MDVDDDFGDLYSDVLLPTNSSKAPSPPSNPDPTTEEVPAPPPPAAAASSDGVKASGVSAPTAEDDDDWLLGGAAPPTVDPISNWADDEEEADANPSKDGTPIASISSPDKMVQERNQTYAASDERILMPDADQEEPDNVIPGLGTAVGPAESDDWDDSDSEDDLKIVLNDTEHGAMDDMGYGEEDDDGGMMMLPNDEKMGAPDQEWGEEGAGPSGEGEGKEGDASKIPGVGGAIGAGQSRIGYGGHAFQHHYKVRDECLLPELLLLCRDTVYTVAYHLHICNSLVSERACPIVDVNQQNAIRSN